MPPLLHKILAPLLPWFRRAPGCAWVEERLPAYLDWDLPPREFRAIERHIHGCAHCRQSLIQLQTLADELLRQAPFLRPVREERIISAIDHQPEPLHGVSGAAIGLLRGRMRQAVVACLALICVPVLAVVVHRHGENLAAYPCAAPVSRSFGAVAAQASPGKDPNCAARIPQNPWFPTDLPIFSDSPDQQFIQKAMEDVVVQEQVLALLPQTDGQYEQWARREYPHVMWFYDVLKAKGTYSGTWQHLLFVSGELLQFDYPLSLAQPNCQPNLGAITRAAAAAGFSFKPGDDGDVLLPALAWRDLLQTRRAALIAAPTVLPCVPPVMADPSDSLSRYAHMLVDDSKTAQKTLIYLFASSMLASEEIQDVRLKNNLASIASESCALLRQILFFPSKQQCVSDANADRLSHLLILRRALVSRALRASQEKAN